MSEIESETKPFLQPLITDPYAVNGISVEAQCALAAWVTLRSMVFETQAQDREPYFGKADRLKFLRDLAPPSNTYILCSPLETPLAASFGCVSGRRKGRAVFHTTYCRLNRVVLYAVFKRPPKTLRTDFQRLDDMFGEATRVIWPSFGHDIDWPTPAYFDDKGFELFLDALKPRPG